MARPGPGGIEYPPVRGPADVYIVANKRQFLDAQDDDSHLDHYYKRMRQARHPHYASHVAYRAVVGGPSGGLAHRPALALVQREPSPRHGPGPGYGPGSEYGHGHGHGHERFAPYPPPHPHPHPLPLPHPRLYPLSNRPSSEPPVRPTTRTTTPAPPMERTASGLSIHSEPTDITERCGSTELLEDSEAAQRVRDHLATFRRRNPDSKHERILRSIINPRSSGDYDDDRYPIDDEALQSIFSAANEIFFNGRLSKRVMWEWSEPASQKSSNGGGNGRRYEAGVIGTTALRRAEAKTRGFETLIVLSSPVLKGKGFSRRLLISTFLHELIHCYMFICCGFRARWCGGHTRGFQEIAEIVDEWAGEAAGLYLSRVEADLALFRVGALPRGRDGGYEGGLENDNDGDSDDGYSCSGAGAEEDFGGGSSSALTRSFSTPGFGTRELVRHQHYRYVNNSRSTSHNISNDQGWRYDEEAGILWRQIGPVRTGRSSRTSGVESDGEYVPSGYTPLRRP